MFVLVALLLFSNGHHRAIIINSHMTLSSCAEAGQNTLKVIDKRFRVLAYKCEQNV